MVSKITCPGCQTPIEFEVEDSGRLGNCPICGIEVTLTVGQIISPVARTQNSHVRHLVLICVFVATLVAWTIMLDLQKQTSDTSAAASQVGQINYATVARYERQANFLMWSFCTNDIIGVREVKRIALHTWAGTNSNDPRQWKGEATVDYINKIGGVERTNIIFHFRLDKLMESEKDPSVWLDYGPWAEAASAASRLEYETWLKRMKE